MNEWNDEFTEGIKEIDFLDQLIKIRHRATSLILKSPGIGGIHMQTNCWQSDEGIHCTQRSS